MEDARGELNATAQREEGAADGDQPAGARVAAAQPRADQRRATPPTSAKPSSQPAWPPSARVRAAATAPVGAAEHAAAAAAARTARAAAGAAGLAVSAAERRCSRGSATRSSCRSVPETHGRSSRRRQRHEQRPGAADDDHRGAAGQQLPHAGEAGRAARPTATPRPARARRAAPRAIFVSNPSPTPTPASTSQRVRPSSSAAHDAPQRRDAAEHEQRVRVVVARDRHGDRRQREHEAGDEAGRRGRSARRVRS